MKPNILLLVIDSFRSDKFYGSEKTSITPNIDKLLDNGVYFPQTISSAPSSIPAISSILTGLFPFKSLQLENEIFNLRQDLPTMIGFLQKDGYFTTATVPNILNLMNIKHIFNEIESYDDQLTLYDGIGETILKKLENINQSKPWLFYLHLNDIHGQAIFHKDFIHPDFDNKNLGQNQYERMISLMDRWIGQFLEKINLEDTLIILTADHGSDVASFDDEMEALSRSAKEKLVVEKNSIIKTGQKITSRLPKVFKPLRRSLSKKYKAKRSAVIEKQINPEIEKIESTQKDPYKKRLLKNLLKSATLPFDERFRIPLLFSGFGINSPKIISKQIRSVDIFPTLLSLLNYQNDFQIHGKNLNFLSDDSNSEELAYIESYKNVQEGISKNLVGIRTSKFKYFRNKDDSTIDVHLFDLQKDPLELHNIVNENPLIVSEMEFSLTKIQDSI